VREFARCLRSRISTSTTVVHDDTTASGPSLIISGNANPLDVMIGQTVTSYATSAVTKVRRPLPQPSDSSTGLQDQEPSSSKKKKIKIQELHGDFAHRYEQGWAQSANRDVPSLPESLEEKVKNMVSVIVL